MARSTSVASAAADGLDAVPGLGDDDEVGLGIDQQAQALPNDMVIVGQQDPGGRCLAHCSLGTVSVTSTPLPGRFSIVSVAPMSIARSRMPRMP